VALSYVYWLPETMFLVLPAAVLFATVFAIGGFTRHSEITAAKASGISFYRLTMPIFLGAALAAGLGLVLGELSPITSTRRGEILGEKERTMQTRTNFVHAADEGVVYKVGFLNAQSGRIDRVEVERHGVSADYPTLVLTAQDGRWRDSVGSWTLQAGALHVIPDSVTDNVFAFDSAYVRTLTATPLELTEVPRDPQDLGYRELGRYIASLERAGGDANELRVERSLKIAIPVTCIIIVLFGAPLATSTQRGGAAYGIGISLATTVLFLILIQLTKAVGGQGLMRPELAAWMPSILFGTVGLLLLARVRT
jgi:lipopolysaccharide export system permease protein